MNRHVLVGRIGSGAAPRIQLGAGEVRSDLRLGDQYGLSHGMQRAITDLRRLDVVPSAIGVDLLILAAMVYAADTRIARASEAQDGWTRELRLVVPVSDQGRWEAAMPVIIRALGFLTGDRWELGFVPRPAGSGRSILPPPLLPADFDGVSLFSGGLDSLIGAIDGLAAGERPLFVSHAGEGAGSSAQSALFDELKAHFAGRTFDRVRLAMAFQHELADGVGSEDSTRARSFLFFALGVAAGTGLGRPFRLKVPENGLIALNVPLDPLRLGALSTRTTHPFYIARWNDLLVALGIDGSLFNPYWDKTKGEMVAACADRPFLMSIADKSISCSSPAKLRWSGLPQGHCGYCLPCLIRRAAMPVGDPTPYFLDDLRARPLRTGEAEGVQVRSFQLAVAKLAARPELAKILIHKPGPLYDHDLADQEKLAGVYARGLTEVGALLDGVRTTPR